jgi:signal transduction histidine kinase
MSTTLHTDDAEIQQLRDELARSRERLHAAEQRAARLAQASATLRSVLDSLQTPDDLEALLGHTLKSIADQVGVRSASAWIFDPDLVAHLVWTIEDGRTLRGPDSSHANAKTPSTPNKWHYEWLRGMGTPAPNVVAVAEHPGLTAEQRAFLLGRGVEALVSVPVVSGKRLVGSFTLHLRSETHPLAEDLELIQALANQASLAFRVTELAEGVRAAAVARERERATEQVARAAHLRAESLAVFSASSRKTLERLASSTDLDAFLGEVLTVAVEQFRAVSGGIWRVLPDGSGRPEVLLEDGQLVTSGFSAEHPAIAPGEAVTELAVRAARSGQIVVSDAEAIATRPEYASFREYLKRKGVRTHVLVPLSLGGAFRGALVVRFAEDRRLTPDEEQLAYTFASQAVLAMELTRLSQAARSAAVTEERNRLARDIHDTIAQGLAAIVRQLETAKAAAPPDAATKHVAIAAEIARESLVEARRSIRALRPPSLEGHTLESALRGLVQRSARLSSSEIRLGSSGPRLALPSDVEDELYRIVNEALVNAVKHASARTIDVDLSFDASSVRIVVRDDGVGFDATTTRGGVGSISMQERAQRIGAVVTVASEPGIGTEVLVYWAA